MNDRALHAGLIGQQGGRAALNTPILIVDLDALERNIAAMAAFASARGIALRPHAKTHKSADIARLQIAAGAGGVCCAKIGEAEALAAEGVESILITSPVVTAPAIERLARLNATMPDLRVVIDNPLNAAALADLIGDGARLKVLIDIDPGIKRTGVASPQAAGALADAIAQRPQLQCLGVQFYCGREQHVASFKERAEKVGERTRYLQNCIAAIEAAGLHVALRTGGGTGSFAIDATLGVLNELQVGSYIFLDRQYLDCELEGAEAPHFDPSLFVETRAVSVNTPGLATLDAGLKSFSTDAEKPVFFAGAPEGAEFFFMGDEHGAVRAKDAQFSLGDRFTLITPHCDPTVNLYDFYHVVRGETLVALWPVTARGRAR